MGRLWTLLLTQSLFASAGREMPKATSSQCPKMRTVSGSQIPMARPRSMHQMASTNLFLASSTLRTSWRRVMLVQVCLSDPDFKAKDGHCHRMCDMSLCATFAFFNTVSCHLKPGSACAMTVSGQLSNNLNLQHCVYNNN